MDQEIAGAIVGIGFFRSHVKVIDHVDSNLVQRLAHNITGEKRMLGVEAPLGPGEIRGTGSQDLSIQAGGQEKNNGCSGEQAANGLALTPISIH